MTREQLIEERKHMTNEEVIKAVISRMSENYQTLYSAARQEYRELRREGNDTEAIRDAKVLTRDFAMKRDLLERLRDTLDERCSCYVNGIDFA